jgi:2-polyprenyl-3-methyl-5-hydroxy-6-metoxy-1,4-benzoquinol methylase
MTDLAQRTLTPEIMDGLPAGDPALRGALRGLERINRWSLSASILWPSIHEFARRRPGQRLRLLDVATGAGDVPLALWRRAKRGGLNLEITACDRNRGALDHATASAERLGARIDLLCLDAVRDPLPEGFDIITSSLFLHHLPSDEVERFLRRLAACGHLLLINDLVRSHTGLLLARVGTRLLSRSEVVHVDGPRSVESAFTREEMKALACAAGLQHATVSPRWPCRQLLRWERP